MSRVFANGPRDQGSIPGQAIPKTIKVVLGAALLNTWHYKVQIKGKVEESREWSSTLPRHLGVVAIEKRAFGLPSTNVANFYIISLSFTTLVRLYQCRANALIPDDKFRFRSSGFKGLILECFKF